MGFIDTFEWKIEMVYYNLQGPEKKKCGARYWKQKILHCTSNI